MSAKFSLGQVVMTSGAEDAMQMAKTPAASLLRRHQAGDWGDVCPEDAEENEFSLRKGFRLFSVYHLSDKTKVWVITEWDRSATTILLPSEY